MPTVQAMKTGGYYDRHSAAQRAVFEGVASWLDEAAQRVPLPEGHVPATLADFGCSEGGNSFLAVERIIAAFRQRRPDLPICAVHSDLPDNDFNRLFTALHDPRRATYLQDHGRYHAGVYAYANAGSFYTQLFPTRSVCFATSFMAVHWLDRVPPAVVPGTIDYARADPTVRAAYERQAAEDLERFLTARAAELVPGGRVLVSVIGRAGPTHASHEMYTLFDRVINELVAEGRIDSERADRFLFPVTFRTVEEMVAPMAAGGPLADRLRVERVQVFEVPTPFRVEYERSGDAASYAEQYVGFLRGWGEPLLRAALLAPGQDVSALDELFERMKQCLRDQPDQHPFHNVEACLLAERL